jgi:hypothetical protein
MGMQLGPFPPLQFGPLGPEGRVFRGLKSGLKNGLYSLGSKKVPKSSEKFLCEFTLRDN